MDNSRKTYALNIRVSGIEISLT